MHDDTKIRHGANVVFRQVADGGVLLNTGTGDYHEVNAIGRTIWEMSFDSTIGEVIEAMRREFPEAGDQVSQDTRDFLTQLADRDLVVLVPVS
ncbi:MAG TPA: PqqD family protein [Acidimicrobiia bacterium]|nr:PqqD family protein [Acidimicrobiia bacterium]